MSFVPLGKQGVGRVKDHSGKLAAILDQIQWERGNPAPLTEGGSCRYEACESDEACTCQLPASYPEPWTEAQLDSVRRLRYEEDA
jgi:hypothetical protein